MKLSRKALKIESEEELAYLFGKKLKEIEYMKLKKPKFSGFFFRSLVFFLSILYNIKFKKVCIKQKPLLIFGGTDNQCNSLKPIISSLEIQQVDYELLLAKGLSKKNILNFPNGQLIKFSFKEFILAFMLFFLNGIPLYFKFKKQHRNVEIDWYFSIFCQVYVYLPYFLNVLLEAKPAMVVMSNDHSVYNRCLRLGAEVLGIKTMYVQHASVSNIFPPLEFDYVLLDGFKAHEIYMQCYENQKGINPRIEKNREKCQIILSGQKKQVVPEVNRHSVNKGCLGLAVNNIDDFHNVKIFLDELADMKVNCILRTHPFQSPIFLDQLMNYIRDKDWLSWSNSREENLVDYFSKINALIAGNTSIHLEAALAGLMTFYYEMSDKIHKSDYYGYVKNGISLKLELGFSLDTIQNLINKVHTRDRNQSIKKYSETFGTIWQNREGELSAWIIKKILKVGALNDLFKTQNSKIYHSVYLLK